MSKNIVLKVKNLVEKEQSPNIPKILELLNRGTPIAIKVCEVLKDGLRATKPVVVDGEIFAEKDFPTIHKYAETIIEILGEKKNISESHITLTVQEADMIAKSTRMALFKINDN